MEVVTLYTATLSGSGPVAVTVDVTISENGLGLSLVGLADDTVRESSERIRSSFEQLGLRMPGRRTTVNLAPGGLPKSGAWFDLPIAVGLLAAMGRVRTERMEETMFFGELSLDGSLRRVQGLLMLLEAATKSGIRRVVVPADNAAEAALIGSLEIIAVPSLGAAIDWLNGQLRLDPVLRQPTDDTAAPPKRFGTEDFADVRGQEIPKRALEIAAAGGHNLLLAGPPGVGKTMLGRVLPTILPPLSDDEAVETTRIHNAAGTFVGEGLMRERPFRDPHHTASAVSLIGGGRPAMPGEISLAHNGVLFLDELPEFGRTALEGLRQPLETGEAVVSRVNQRVVYPARFMFVATMNLCPCGNLGHPHEACTCSQQQIRQYMSQISAPLMDRFDLRVEVMPVGSRELHGPATGETSAEVRRRVMQAREMQRARFGEADGVPTNARMTVQQQQRCCRLDADSERLLQQAAARMSLSARGYTRILRVARTIADLAGREEIGRLDVAEAIGYRRFGRGGWGTE